MNATEVLEGLSHSEKKVLVALQKLEGRASPEKVFEAGDFQQLVEVMNAASWLQSKGAVDIEESARKAYALRDRSLLEKGVPERRAIALIGEKGGSLGVKDLEAAMGKEESSMAIGWLMKKKLARLDKSGTEPMLHLSDEGRANLGREMPDEALLKKLGEGDIFEDQADKAALELLKARKGVLQDKLIVSRVLRLNRLGNEIVALGVEITDEVAQLTPELLQTGKWKGASFRKYDIRTFAPCQYPAKKHPITRIADEVRRIFIEMGFNEIDDEYVQSAFWNMDALFTPQDHPARELQDTFYLKSPGTLPLEDEEIVQRVKAVHENGGDTGSLGWRYAWCREEAERALLRTHTTVNTIKYLAKHPDPPAKVFCISRVFRNESIDMTHLPEFQQIEGIIMEEGANFDMLVCTLKDFYHRMGFDKVRVRPGPFPYTEPSLEVDVFYNGSWMELGGAGVFRPEVTGPLGIKHPVLAWGLGFERLAMLKWNLKDVRELYVTDLDMLRQNPIF
ncbi:MAG: Phenylalanine--tRNA ligase alpha subunit [Methanomassiliicoccales archaeon PtaB.Bin215]|nr:MAG: Phenylalanine--tRNA ligase alpha subunit [Methanomassiliicoccales archaeon PtaB.Bin215]